MKLLIVQCLSIKSYKIDKSASKTNEFSKIVEYKIYGSLLYSYIIGIENWTFKFKKYNLQQYQKYLSINLTKDVYDLYTENDKALLKERRYK